MGAGIVLYNVAPEHVGGLGRYFSELEKRGISYSVFVRRSKFRGPMMSNYGERVYGLDSIKKKLGEIISLHDRQFCTK